MREPAASARVKIRANMDLAGREPARSSSGRASKKLGQKWRAPSRFDTAGEPRNGARPELVESSVQLASLAVLGH